MSKKANIKHTKPWCCYSRLGMAKAVYESREAAELVIASHDTPQEAYRCRINKGKWHIRAKRVRVT